MYNTYNWTPVGKALPDKNGVYLCTVQGECEGSKLRFVDRCVWNGREFTLNNQSSFNPRQWVCPKDKAFRCVESVSFMGNTFISTTTIIAWTELPLAYTEDGYDGDVYASSETDGA